MPFHCLWMLRGTSVWEDGGFGVGVVFVWFRDFGDRVKTRVACSFPAGAVGAMGVEEGRGHDGLR